MDNKFKVETSVASRSLFENGCLFTAAAFEYRKSWSFNILLVLIWIRGKHDPCLCPVWRFIHRKSQALSCFSHVKDLSKQFQKQKQSKQNRRRMKEQSMKDNDTRDFCDPSDSLSLSRFTLLCFLSLLVTL
ncbi:unnamed protein product [Brassica oleracea var. botrytis]